MNKVFLIGHLGQDPEMMLLESGSKLAKFSLATNESYKNQAGDKIERTEWHRIVAFNRLAEFAEKWLKKGKPIRIEGKLSTRNWEENGTKRYMTEIIADNFSFLPGTGTSSQPSQQEPAPAPASEPAGETTGQKAAADDDLPF